MCKLPDVGFTRTSNKAPHILKSCISNNGEMYIEIIKSVNDTITDATAFQLPILKDYVPITFGVVDNGLQIPEKV